MVKEIKSLTGIRGIAAFYVMVFHFVVAYPSAESTFFNNQFLLNGYLAVDMFFILSALVMSLAYERKFSQNLRWENYKKYIVKRLIRIFPAYFVWLILYCIFLSKINLVVILANLFFVQNFFGPDYVVRGVLWSLSSEFILYILFPFLFFLLKRLKISIQLLLLMFIFLGRNEIFNLPTYFIDGFTIDSMEEQNLGSNSILRCFTCYIMGIIGFNFVERFNSFFSNEIVKRKVGAANYIFLVLFIVVTVLDYKIFSILFMFLIIVSLYILKDEYSKMYANKIIYFLGIISYSLYLCHLWVSTSFNIVNKRLLHIDNYYFILCIIIILSIVVAKISYTIFEKWMASKLNAKIK